MRILPSLGFIGDVLSKTDLYCNAIDQSDMSEELYLYATQI
jgi:hypothetical protein